jgi:hypothetical protein
MVAARVERRLAAVLAVDVAGYSRLMGGDEEGTLARLKECRRALVDPQIAEQRGRIVKTTGDGMLVGFASAVHAIRCAAEVQRGMANGNSGVPEAKRIEFRIGIHVGDIIIIDDNDIFGDGVNIIAEVVAVFGCKLVSPLCGQIVEPVVVFLVTCPCRFPPDEVRFRPSEGRTNEAKQVYGRADYRRVAGA